MTGKFPLPDDYFDGQANITQGAGDPAGHLAKLLNLLNARVYNNATRPAASEFTDGTQIVNVDDKDVNIAIGGKWYRNGIET